MSDELFEKFMNLACQMSPENLSCDGELPHRQAMRRLRQIKAEWAQLETELGRKITENQVWVCYMERDRVSE